MVKKFTAGDLLLFFLLGLASPVLAQKTYFVSPGGQDRNNGSRQFPFQTVERAKEEARKTNGEVVIYLLEGVYRLADPLIFTPEDGMNDKSLTIRSYPGEKAIIAGGILLNPTWESHTKEIMKTKITPPVDFDMLLVNGEIRHLARYPDYDPAAVRFNGTSADATSPDRVKRWKNPVGGYLHAMHAHDWGDFHYRITGKDKKGNLQLEGGHQNNRQSGLSVQNRMVENIFEELDAPGEWYYDQSGSTLYYYPVPGEDVHNARFEVPQLKHLIEFRGTENNPVKNIFFKDITFTQTTRTFMETYEPLLRSDWTIYRGGAVIFEGTENCGLTNCFLHHLGGNAIFFLNYNRNSIISGSHITQIGASAICFVGDPEAVRSPAFEYGEFVSLEEMDRTAGPKTNNYPANCLVHDNLIYKIGLFEKQITGIELSMCRFITISHNSVYDTPRAGINISEGTWGGHVIEYNDIFDTVKETGDHGSFNSWGRDRFWHPDYKIMCDIVANEPSLIPADAISTVTIRNNRFRCDRGWDIDLDDGASNYRIYNNLCLNGGIKLREGFYRVVENNILVNNTFHPHVWFENSGDVFTRNIVMSPYQPIRVQEWGAETDYNIFTDSLSYKAARENNTDGHSIVCPVNFRNPETGDYSIDNHSTEVFRIGFQNFDMHRFGVLSPRLRQLARTPKMSLPVITKDNAGTGVISWNGWHIKNLETLGERSATGMDAERGVYVVTSIAFDNPLRDILQANDVILKFGNKPVNNLSELFEAIGKSNLKTPQEIIIFRNQRENSVTIPGNTIR